MACIPAAAQKQAGRHTRKIGAAISPYQPQQYFTSAQRIARSSMASCRKVRCAKPALPSSHGTIPNIVAAWQKRLVQSNRRCIWLRAESGLYDGQRAEDRREEWELSPSRKTGGWMVTKNVLWRMCKWQFLNLSVVALKVQSKVEHLTRVTFLLDSWNQQEPKNLESNKKFNQGLDPQEMAHYLHQPFVNFDISQGRFFLVWLSNDIHLWRHLIQIQPGKEPSSKSQLTRKSQVSCQKLRPYASRKLPFFRQMDRHGRASGRIGDKKISLMQLGELLISNQNKIFGLFLHSVKMQRMCPASHRNFWRATVQWAM